MSFTASQKAALQLQQGAHPERGKDLSGLPYFAPSSSCARTGPDLQSIFLELELLPFFAYQRKTYGKPMGSLAPKRKISGLLIYPNKTFAVLLCVLEGGGGSGRQAHCLQHRGTCLQTGHISGKRVPLLWKAVPFACPPQLHKDTKPHALSLQTSQREQDQGLVLCLHSAFRTLRAQNGSPGPPRQGARLCAYPVSLRHHQPIAPALFGVTETVNHALRYLFIRPGFITALLSFLHTAPNIFECM